MYGGRRGGSIVLMKIIRLTVDDHKLNYSVRRCFDGSDDVCMRFLK